MTIFYPKICLCEIKVLPLHAELGKLLKIYV